MRVPSVLAAVRARLRGARRRVATARRSSSRRRTAASTTRLPVLAASPVEAIGARPRARAVPSGLDAATASALAGKTLVGGVIDGHNIWRGDLEAALRTSSTRCWRSSPDVAVGTSTSLLHVPHDVDDEPALAEQLTIWLAFADQKVGQVATLATGLRRRPRRDRRTSCAPHPPRSPTAASAPGVRDGAVRARAAGLTDADFSRGDVRRRVWPPRRRRSACRSCRRRRSARSRRPATSAGRVPRSRRVRSREAEYDGPACATRSRASSTCRRRSASTCSCTASPSATTWCSTSPRTSTVSP